MKKVGSLVLKTLVFLAVANFNLVNVQAQNGPQTTPGGKKRDVPQEFVVCTGWHALCSASFDCRMIGNPGSCGKTPNAG